MNPLLPSLLVAALLLGACATRSPAPVPGAVAAPAPSPTCLRETGTHLEFPEGRCVAHGRVITREDLNRTGAVDLGGALLQLVPF